MQQHLTLIKGDKSGDDTEYRDFLPVNMSGVVRPMFGAAGYMLQQPGLTLHGAGVGVDRGGIWNERLSTHFRVSGSSLITVTATGQSATLGSVSGTGTASLPYSFNTQGVITGGKFWLYDATAGFREVTDTDLGSPIDGIWIDGYYFMTDGEYLFHTDLADESAIDPLKFATAEFMPDASLGIGKTADNKAMVFGRYSIEYFANVATANFAFQRIATRAIKAGIVGTHCKAEILDRWFILGGRKEEDVSVHVVGVGSIEKIASREVDKVINKYTEAQLSACSMEPRVEDDAQYLILHLPNETLLYNLQIARVAGNESAWTELKSIGNWRGVHGIFEPRLGKWVYGDKLGPNLGVLDNSVSTHYGNIAEWVLTTPFTYLDSKSIDMLEIETVSGQNTSDDATVFLSLTYNGVTYGKEVTMTYGKPGAFNQRFIQRRLGYVRDWVGFKLRGSTKSRMSFSQRGD